ncbi:VanZ family protein [Corynebacterium callunae]|uniref:VanZ family protein n=1 Tax=Corynebacterium callunae TaxID=1721 RepID=UPI0039829773
MKFPRARFLAAALIAYSAVMVSLTMLKSFFVIGLLWVPVAHRNRSLSLVPLNDFFAAESWFAPLFGYGGNFAFFVPFGVLLFALLEVQERSLQAESGQDSSKSLVRGTPRRLVLKTAGWGALFSLSIECAQYIFRLGYSDIDDVIFNALGAAVGALIARVGLKVWDRRSYWLWVILALILTLVFAVLVALGPRLGDPDKVVELGASFGGDVGAGASATLGAGLPDSVTA